MIDKELAAYWIAFGHIPKWNNEKINKLIIKIIHQKKISIGDFWTTSVEDWIENFSIPEKDIFIFQNIKNELPNYSFLAEDMINQGYKIIPINSHDYSSILKDNLKVKYSPPILYIKGNKELLKKHSIAIVGTRDASDISLSFTDNIAKKATNEGKVVVSGFAKGVDQHALNSAIKYGGQSIIVLPQGIMTFSSGFEKYYSHIIKGNVLVLSTFYPKAPWNKGLAMARNAIIYGLAEEIYVAEANEKGGTFSGVIDGLRKKRKISIRNPEAGEKNANHLLVEKGAIPVDFNGIALSDSMKMSTNKLSKAAQLLLFE